MPTEAPPLEKRSPEDTRRIIARISKFVFKWKKQCIILITAILLTIACQLIVPILVQKAINCLIYRTDSTFVQDLTKVVTSLVMVFILNSIIEYVKNVSAMQLSENLSLQMRRDLFERVIHAPLSYLDTHSYGDIMSRLTNDSQRVSTVAQVLEEFMSKIIVIIGCAIIMLSKNWKLALISIVTALVTTIISGIISGRMRNYFMRQTMALGSMNGHLEESVKNFRTMEIAGIGSFTSETMAKKSQEYTDVCIKSSMFSAIINPIMLVLGNLSFMITVVVGGHFAIEDVITIGVLQAVIMYSKQFMDSVYSFGNVMIQTQSFLASAERVFELIDMEIEDTGEGARLVKQGEDEKLLEGVPEKGVAYKDVTFSYDGERTVVDDITLSLEGGKTAALVGATGAGKTTLTSLLLKFYDTYEGDIFVDGVNLRDYSLEKTRNMVTVVLQDSKLVEGTIAENILYGATDKDEDDTLDIVKKMGVLPLIEKLPDGLNTMTSDDDETISEGMRQIIGLARAVIREPRILIMDEALSAVDPLTEQMVRSNIFSITPDATILVIAHRLKSTETIDKIIVMKDGHIAEEGSFEELMESRGEYHRLYTSQQSGNEI
ncbi:MAG: ABC transporter ATP-binding protein/permease [Eubacterium sp.]|jgi:ABC-type multidrug transport system, ATPase and permease components|nr:ABC transporter ATP-binding protein/permease [Eubacterium sp.]